MRAIDREERGEREERERRAIDKEERDESHHVEEQISLIELVANFSARTAEENAAKVLRSGADGNV